jgi:YesN/AraC family two-component response regulator
MTKNIRTKTYLKENNLLNSSEYLKKIYKKNLSWNPPPASSIIEEKITEFEKAHKTLLQKARKKHEICRLSNLNHLQWSALQQLRRIKDITIKPSDKNLGPTAMDTTTYIRQVLQEHLLTSTYKQLSQREAKNIMEQLKTYLKELLSQHSKYLSKPELIYFQRSLKEFHRLPIFYGLPKVHKEPISLRLV